MAVAIGPTGTVEGLVVPDVILQEITPPRIVPGVSTSIINIIGEFPRGPVDRPIASGGHRQLNSKVGSITQLDPGDKPYAGLVALTNKVFTDMRTTRMSNDKMKASRRNILAPKISVTAEVVDFTAIPETQTLANSNIDPSSVVVVIGSGGSAGTVLTDLGGTPDYSIDTAIGEITALAGGLITVLGGDDIHVTYEYFETVQVVDELVKFADGAAAVLNDVQYLANSDIALDRVETDIVPNPVAVRVTDSVGTPFENIADYLISFDEGRITRVSGGLIDPGEEVKVTYWYKKSVGQLTTANGTGFDNYGVWGDGLDFSTDASANGNVADWKLTLREDDVIVEEYDNLSVTSTADRYQTTVINNSLRVKFNEITANTTPDRALTVRDFFGGQEGTFDNSDFKRAIDAAELDEEITLMVPAYRDDYDAAFVTQLNKDLITHCETFGGRSGYISREKGLTVDGLVTFQQGVDQTDSHRMVGSYPWLYTFVNELNTTLLVPPNSFVAGILASQSPHIGPGNNRITSISGTEFLFTRSDLKRIINSRYIPISEVPRSGIRTRSNNNTSSKANLDRVTRTRMFDFILQSVTEVIQEFVGRPHTAQLRAEAVGVINGFLNRLLRQGMIGDPNGQREPYQVVSDATNNPPDEIALRRLNVDTKVLLFQDADFIILRAEVGSGIVTPIGV